MSHSPDFEVRGADWVRQVTDAQIVQHVGELSYERALVYVDSERVLTINTGDRGRLLLSTVDGSRDRPYTVMITRLDDIGGDPDWTSRCSCPVATECKHVAATLLTARDAVGGRADPIPAWRRFVQQQLDDSEQRAAADDGVRLGLRIGTSRELQHGRPATRIFMSPSHFTKAGRWSKQTSWDDVAANRFNSRFNVEQAQALSRIHRLARGSAHAVFYSGANLFLDECGPAVWGALHEVADAGVELLPSYNGEYGVTLVPDPVRVAADFQRQQDGSVVGRADVVGLPDDDGELLLVGEPPHGVVLRGYDQSLTLAGTDRLITGPALAMLLDGPVEVPAQDADEFIDLYLPRLARRLHAVVDADTEPVPLRLRLTVTSPEPQSIEVTTQMLYAGRHLKAVTPDLYDRTRDRKAEHELVQRLESKLHDAGLLHAIGGLGWWPVERVRLSGWRAVRFAERLDAFAELDDIDLVVDGELPVFEESTSTPQINIGAADSEDNDWLDLHVTVTIDGEDVPFAPLFAALARGDEAMLLDSGTWFTLDHPELHQLERLIAEAKELSDKQREGLSINRFQVGLWEELESIGVVDQQSSRWAQQIERIRGLDEFTRPTVPDGLKATLRPYQLDGFTWLAALWDCALGGVLADDMGLGKTLQTLALLARAREEGELAVPVLVVAPSSVVGTWVSEAGRFAPDLRVVALAETSKRRGTTVAEAIAGAEVVVTSYAVLRLDDEQFAETDWNGLVLDEAQSVKNHQSKTFQAAKRVGAPFTLAITGTPLENSLMDLWSMLALAAPGLYPRPDAFTQRYRKPIERGEAPELLDQLRQRIRPLMLRRTKDQVASDLPPKQEQTLSVTLTPRHRQTYDRQLQRERQRILGLLDDPDANRVEILASLTRLRQLALDPRLVDPETAAPEISAKLAVLVEQLVELAQEGHRALVFSQFTSYLSLARDALTQAGLTSSYLDGRTRSRQKVIDDFKQGDQAAFLISLKAGGVGLTLTEADYVFVLDPWWNPATEAQAIDRAHRIGQDKPVMVYRLVSAGTIEEKVVALQQRKRALFEQVVDGGGALGGAITPDDIRGLLQ
ncbi:DEAD/DEAH box helicase [Flexivirga meconopsidis]|uniref:DEAD/DEAH box helicase n=1 Tax=Flexivirga meconopsidis TaxID=2977121 RepID=UPI00223EF293